MKKTYIFSFLLYIGSYITLVANPSHNVEALQLETWLEGQVIGGNTLMIYFNLSDREFSEIVESMNIEDIQIDFFSKNKNGTSFDFIGSEHLPNVDINFDVIDWSFPIENVNTTEKKYLAQVLINGEFCKTKFEIPIVTPTFSPAKVNSLGDLPLFSCSEDNEETDETNLTLVSHVPIDQLAWFQGFPILITNCTTSCEPDEMNGEGVIRLPFLTGVSVKVVLDAVSVYNGTFGYVIKINNGGSIRAVSDNPGVYPDFYPVTDTYHSNQEICIVDDVVPDYENGVDPLTGSNDYGFDPETGLHYSTNTIYDPNGYDANGIHKDTGTPYAPINEDGTGGCSRDGLTQEGEHCTVGSGGCSDAITYAQSTENPDITQMITDIINNLKNEYTNKINSTNFSTIQGELNTLITYNALDQERAFFFGENDILFDQNMHLQFNTKPKILTNDGLLERQEHIKQIEAKHIELYNADKTFYGASRFLNELNTIDLSALETQIRGLIAGWTTYECSLYLNNENATEGFIKRSIGLILLEKTGLDVSYAYNKPNLYKEQPNERHYKKHLESIFKIDHGLNQSTAIVSTNPDFGIYNEKYTLEQASFDFLQGEKYINGVSRAFYLEELARQQALQDEESESLLPVKIPTIRGNRTYNIYLDNIQFLSGGFGGTFDAYMVIEDPESGRKLSFKGEQIPFGNNGLLGDVHSSKLILENDVEIRLNNAAMLTLTAADGLNFIEWGCQGFETVSIDGKVEFCREFITPLDGNFQPLSEDQRYSLDISARMDNWLDFTTTFDSPSPFVVTKHDNVIWDFSNIVLDLSSESTPSFQPANGYVSPFWNGSTMSAAWKGFYIDSILAKVTDFKGFNNNSSGDLSINGQDILIDRRGFTGGVAVILPVDNEYEGKAGKWPITIERFSFNILNNKFAGGGLGGKLTIPLLGDESWNYQASIQNGNSYTFSVDVPTDPRPFDIFLATIDLDRNCKIVVDKQPSIGLFAHATLNGKLSFNANLPRNLKLPQLKFTDFTIGSREGIELGKWEVLNTNSLSDYSIEGFGFDIGNISLFNNSTQLGLTFNVNYKLTATTDKLGLSANGDFKLSVDKGLDNDGFENYTFGGISLEAARINASNFPGVDRLDATLEWYEDTSPNSKWGKGFRGTADLQIAGFGGGIEAIGQFGTTIHSNATPWVDTYRYFFVDALCTLPEAVNPTGATGLKLTGFGGGVSYNMTRTAPSNPFANGFVDTTEDEYGNTVAPLPQGLGTSISGATYEPHKPASLGLSASISLATVDDYTFNGVATMSMTFKDNNNGGIGSLDVFSLSGAGQFLRGKDLSISPDLSGFDVVEANQTKPNSIDAPLSAYVDLRYDVTHSVFDGTFTAFLDSPFLKGTMNDHGKFVDAHAHFESGLWYTYIGTPSQPAGIRAQLTDNIGVNLQAYFMVGNAPDMPSMASLPEEVTSIATKVNNNESFRRDGKGIIFGARGDVKAKAEVLFLDAEINGGVGYDVMLKRYEGLMCNNNPVGIDGWYASGQMWAYLTGELKLFGLNIIDAGLAAVLQARLPNPFWAQATVGAYAKPFIGPKFKVDVKVQVGEDCSLTTDDISDLIGMDIISNVTPNDDEQDVSTLSDIKITYALPIHEDVSYKAWNGENVQYFIQVYKNDLIENGTSIYTDGAVDYAYNLSIDGTQQTLRPKQELKPNTEYLIQIGYKVYQKDGNGYKTLIEDATESFSFRTQSNFESKIATTNVRNTFPIDGMCNVYKDQESYSNTLDGHIKLIKAQPYLFFNLPSGYETKVKLTSQDGVIQYYDFELLQDMKEINFALPKDQLLENTMYKLELVQVQTITLPNNANPNTASSGTIIDDVFTSHPTIPSNESTPISLTSNIAEKSLYTMVFRVSQYATIDAKIASLQNRINTSSDKMKVEQIEPFDELEINGKEEHYAPLLSLKPLTTNDWSEEGGYAHTLLENYDALFNEDYGINGEILYKNYFIKNSFEINPISLITLEDFNQGSINPSPTNIIYYQPEAALLQILNTLNQNIPPDVSFDWFDETSDLITVYNDCINENLDHQDAPLSYLCTVSGALGIAPLPTDQLLGYRVTYRGDKSDESLYFTKQ